MSRVSLELQKTVKSKFLRIILKRYFGVKDCSVFQVYLEKNTS